MHSSRRYWLFAVFAMVLLSAGCSSPGGSASREMQPLPAAVSAEADSVSMAAPLNARITAAFDPTRGSYGAIADKHLLPIYLSSGKAQERYCGCSFNEAKEIDEDCGYDRHGAYSIDAGAADRTEWEHIVPASRMVAAAGCASRDTCKSDYFKSMENDPYNLIPVIGSLNRKRSNSAYAEIQGETRYFGTCDFEIGSDSLPSGRETTYFEPPNKFKGDVARVTFYMARQHNIPVPPDLCMTYVYWAEHDPVSLEEKTIAEEIRSFSKINNPYSSGSRAVTERECSVR